MNMLYKSLVPQQVMSPASAESLTASAQRPKNRKWSKLRQEQNVELRLERNRKKKAVRKRDMRPMKPQESPQAKKPYTEPKTKSSKAKNSSPVQKLFIFTAFISLLYTNILLLPLPPSYTQNVRSTRRIRESRTGHSRERRRLPKMEILYYQRPTRKNLRLDDHWESQTNKRIDPGQPRDLGIPRAWLQRTSSLHLSLHRNQRTPSRNEEKRRYYSEVSCAQILSRSRFGKWRHIMKTISSFSLIVFQYY